MEQHIEQHTADLDQTSNIIFVGAATSLVISLSWAGTTYAWTSGQVLAPLIIGLCGIAAFVYLDQWSSNPTVPMEVLKHPTSVVGFVETLLQSLIMMAIVYFRPSLYFQVCSSYVMRVDAAYAPPVSGCEGRHALDVRCILPADELHRCTLRNYCE